MSEIQVSGGNKVNVSKWIIGGICAFLAFVALHTGVLIWTLGTITANQSHIQNDIAEIKVQMIQATADRYTATDAARDFAEIKAELLSHEQRQAEVDRRQWEQIENNQD